MHVSFSVTQVATRAYSTYTSRTGPPSRTLKSTCHLSRRRHPPPRTPTCRLSSSKQILSPIDYICRIAYATRSKVTMMNHRNHYRFGKDMKSVHSLSSAKPSMQQYNVVPAVSDDPAHEPIQSHSSSCGGTPLNIGPCPRRLEYVSTRYICPFRILSLYLAFFVLLINVLLEQIPRVSRF